MGRTTTVTPQQLLDAGLDLIIRQGYAAVNIKTVAQAAGCSTQPIVWAFGNIEGYRAALRRHATVYAQAKTQGTSPADGHANAGYAYIDMAIEAPNLIRYLRSDEQSLRQSGGIAMIFDPAITLERRKFWEQTLDVTAEEAQKFVDFCVVHTEGIVSLLLSGVLPADKEKAYRLLREGGEAYAMYLKKG
jgi:AcrR family transcriptional regulator